MTARPKCRGCGHADHVKACRARGPSRCQTWASDDGATGFACGSRPPCPCSWRVCPCGFPVALAAELPPAARTLPDDGEVMIVTLERGSARDPAGCIAVRKLTGGHLACRDLPDGEDPRPGEWRAREHTNAACKLLATAEADARWLILAAA